MISLDKKYRTKRGLEVRLYAVDGIGKYSVHGAVGAGGGKWFCATWDLNGRAGHITDNEDLIEVTPKKPRLLAWRSADGAIHLFDSKPTLDGWTRAPWLDEKEVTE